VEAKGRTQLVRHEVSGKTEDKKSLSRKLKSQITRRREKEKRRKGQKSVKETTGGGIKKGGKEKSGNLQKKTNQMSHRFYPKIYT